MTGGGAGGGNQQSSSVGNVTGGVGGNSGILTLAAATASQSLSSIIAGGVPYSVQSSNAAGNTGPMGTNTGSSFAVVTNRGTSLQGVIPVATSIGNANNSVTAANGQQQQQVSVIKEVIGLETFIYSLFEIPSSPRIR